MSAPSESNDIDRLPKAARRVARFLAEADYPWQVLLLPDTARTAVEAATALGCEVGEIAKSVVFRLDGVDPDGADHDGGHTAVVVVAGGSTRVDEQRLEELVGPIAGADASFVKAATGYSIGGVSPFGLASSARLLVDRSLDGLARCFCAAGHPHAVVQTTFEHLIQLSGAEAVDVT